MPNENAHFRGVQVRRSVAAAIAWLVVVFLWISPTISLAGEEGWLRIGGLAFGDVYRVVSHHTEEGEGATGLVLRRGYLTFDADRSTKWFGRLRFEVNQAGDNISYLPFDPSAPATFFIGGIEFRITRHFIVTPNTVVITYDRNDEGIRPRTDWHLRVAFILDFE